VLDDATFPDLALEIHRQRLVIEGSSPTHFYAYKAFDPIDAVEYTGRYFDAEQIVAKEF
jgi:hypothetical protein